MSTEETTSSAASAPPDDQQALQAEIEQTRQHLGETVDALAAKADVKAQAQNKARQLTGQAQDKAREVTGQAQDKARQVTGRVKSTAAQGKHRASTAASTAATSISNATPEPVKGAAGNAAAVTKRNRRPLAAVAGAVAAGVLGWLVIRRWRSRS